MFDGIRRALARLGTLGTVVIGVGLWEVGARVLLPGLKPDVLAEIVRTKGTLVLRLYDLLAGGALARGALLALGILPYFAASLWIRVARVASGTLESMWQTRAGRERIREWRRRLTVGFAVVQSIGFSIFAQNNGAAPEGLGFIATTLLIFTSGSILTMLVTEQLSQSDDSDLPEEGKEEEADAVDAPVAPHLSAGAAPAEPIRTARPEGVRTRE